MHGSLAAAEIKALSDRVSTTIGEGKHEHTGCADFGVLVDCRAVGMGAKQGQPAGALDV